MFWRLITICLSVYFLLFAAPVRAEKSEYKEGETAVKGLLFGAQDIFVELHGFLNVEAYNFQSGASSSRRIPSFDLHNFYLSAKAQPAKGFTAFAEVEYEHGTEQIKIDRAFIDWEAFTWGTIRIGRFYSAITYERSRYWAPVRPMTSRPLTVDIAMNEWSETGIEILGYPVPRKDFIYYELGVMNGPRGLSGAGIPVSLGDDDRDNNRNKTFVGRLNVNPLRGLTLGSAYATGKYDDAGDLQFNIIEFDARYTFARLDLWGEYMKRTGDDEPAPVPTNPFITGVKAGFQGYYLLAAYHLIEDRRNVNYLAPIVRYDMVEETSSGAGKSRVTVGLNYSPRKHVVFKSEYQFVHELTGAQLKNNGAMFSAVLDF